jgi:hypothetical protein
VSKIETRPTLPMEQGLEPKKETRFPVKYRVISAVAGVALLSGIGVGIHAATSGEKPAEATSTSAPADPTESAAPSVTPTPEATPTTAPETQVGPDISKYEAMSVAEFSALSNDEQMIFATGKLVPNIKQFAADYESFTNNPNDVLPQGSIDNTAQEIDTQVTYNLRFAFMLTGDDREKFIIAVLRNNNQSGIYPIIESMSKTLFNSNDGKDMGYFDKISVGTASPDMGPLQEDTNHDKFRQISVTDKDGTTGSVNAYYIEVPLPNGSVYKTWIRE